MNYHHSMYYIYIYIGNGILEVTGVMEKITMGLVTLNHPSHG